MMSLATAMLSTSKRARSAPKMRSALSILLPQSEGNDRVTVLMSSRFSSAALVQQRCVPPPSRYDDDEGTNEGNAFERATPGPFRDKDRLPFHAAPIW
jgi:hypothetical protein